MIKTIELKNFTVLRNGVFEFSPGLNVFVAENGMGKSHLLKLLYVLSTFADNPSARVNESSLTAKLVEILTENFRAEAIERLIRRQQGLQQCRVDIHFDDEAMDLGFKVTSRSKLVIDKKPAQFSLGSVFIPTRELMTLCPWFLPAYEAYHLEFERTWRDTCVLLQAPGRKGSRGKVMASILEELEEALHGQIIMDSKTNRLYLKSSSGTLEMPLVAEGLRKLGMLFRLIQTGTFEERKVLFWDEPEANLNPKYIRIIAKCIWTLASQGIQTFVASHSLILLRELMMLQQEAETSENSKNTGVRWFSLNGPDEEAEAAENLFGIHKFVALDTEQEQAEKLLGMEF